MKKLVILLIAAVCAVVGGSLYADDNYSDDIYVSDKVTVKEQKKLDKAERKRQQAISDSIEYQLAVKAVEDKHFVIVADQIRGRYGRTLNVNRTTNFVLVQGDTAVVQFALEGVMNSPNGIGGVTAESRITKHSLSYDKHGNMNYTMYVNGTALTGSITFSLPKGSKRCSATVSANFSSDQLTFSGYLEPYNSFLYQGHSLK